MQFDPPGFWSRPHGSSSESRRQAGQGRGGREGIDLLCNNPLPGNYLVAQGRHSSLLKVPLLDTSELATDSHRFYPQNGLKIHIFSPSLFLLYLRSCSSLLAFLISQLVLLLYPRWEPRVDKERQLPRSSWPAIVIFSF